MNNMELIEIEHNALNILSTLQKEGFEAYIVGGCIRDTFLERDVKDWDITTNASPDILLKIFPQAIPTGIKHGTVTVVMEGNNYEITTYRVDGEYDDYRKPTNVIFTDSLAEDLSRRDFTINAMAYNPQTGLVDPFNGRSDLEQRIIIAVGKAPDRFQEDALRMMRAVRFACQLAFDIEEQTFLALKENSHLVKMLSAERIRDELNRIIMSQVPSRGILLLNEGGILEHILPELKECEDFDQRNPHHHHSVLQHIMAVIDATPPKREIRLAALFHDIAKPLTLSIDKEGVGHFYGHDVKGADISEMIMRRLRYDKETVKKVHILIKEHMARYNYTRMVNLKKFINKVGRENLDDLFELQIADIKGSNPPHDYSAIINFREQLNRILSQNEPLTLKDLAIDGDDLLEIGISPGPPLGEALKWLLEQVLDKPPLNSKRKLLELIKRRYKIPLK